MTKSLWNLTECHPMSRTFWGIALLCVGATRRIFFCRYFDLAHVMVWFAMLKRDERGLSNYEWEMTSESGVSKNRFIAYWQIISMNHSNYIHLLSASIYDKCPFCRIDIRIWSWFRLSFSAASHCSSGKFYGKWETHWFISDYIDWALHQFHAIFGHIDFHFLNGFFFLISRVY